MNVDDQHNGVALDGGDGDVLDNGFTEDARPPAPLSWWADAPALLVFALLFFTVALQFFTRYVLNDSLGWTEEIARYFLILLGFTGGVICMRNNSHIALEFLSRHLPPAVAMRLQQTCTVIVLLFFFYCGYLAIELAMRTNSNMASIALPKAIIYYIVSLQCFLMAVAAALQLARRPPSSHSDANTIAD